jgi:hypothetical protein
MDNFKKCSLKFIGPGGIHCNCCNSFHNHGHGKHKQKLVRLSRHIFKKETLKEIQIEKDSE